MPRPKRFYVVATGQGQANLPPIFALSSPGDVVVWIETPLASRSGYAETSIPILRARGLDNVQLGLSDADSMSPERLKSILVADIHQHRDHDPILVGTGGPKYMVFGTDRAAVELRFPVAYSDVRPAMIRMLDDPSGSFAPRPFVNPIQLDEWLAVNRLCPAGRCPPSAEVWPNHAAGLDPSRDEGFSTEPEYQRALFAIHAAKAKFRTQHPHADPASQPPVPVDPAYAARLKADGWLPPSFDSRIPGAQSPGSAAGDRFEEAVALRAAQFLNDRPSIAAVASTIRKKVFIAGAKNPSECFAEYDVAILLKNATLIDIDCKLGRKAEEKETYASLGKLQQAGGSSASLVFCIALFPELGEHSHEFNYLYRPYTMIRRLQQVNRNLGLLFYTNRRQTGDVVCRAGDDEPFTVIPFEKGLENLLRDYVPKPESAAGAR